MGGTSFRYSIAASLVIISALPTTAQPQKTALVDDVSRGELFEVMAEDIMSSAPPADVSLFAFKANFRFPHDAQWRNPVLEQDPRSGQVFGIDVSHHNTDKCHCNLDWQKLASQKVEFAYLKASQGVSYYDDSFDRYLTGIRKVQGENRIAVGAYHFLSADGSAEDQAQNFLDITKGKVGADDLPPTLDVEWDVRTANHKVILGPDGKSKDFWVGTDGPTILARVRRWLALVEASTHHHPIVYTNAEWWRQRIGDPKTIESSLAPYRVWISDLSTKGLRVEQPYLFKGTWDLWQFTFTASPEQGGLPPGSLVDADVYAGSSIDDLRR